MGEPNAMFMIATFYQYGKGGLPHDIGKSIEYLKRAVRTGQVGPASRIGYLYLYGVGVEQSIGEAAKWYALDASRGYIEAIDKLATAYLAANQGKDAIALYEKAAARNIYQANAAIGMIYMYGAGGVTPDRERALKWYLKAEDRGDPIGAIQAATILKDMNPPDDKRALWLLSRYGSPVAVNDRAYMIEKNRPPPATKMEADARPTALELYKRAADMCYGRAMYNIGRLFDTGADDPRITKRPIQPNPKAARRWMESGAAYGSVAAAIWLDQHNGDSPKAGQKMPEMETAVEPKPCTPKGEKK
jgi:TPR repeat protein